MVDQAELARSSEAWASSCAKIPLSEYVSYCLGFTKKKHAPSLPWALQNTPTTVQDLVSLLCALGQFEPAGAHRPGACDIVTSFDDVVEVPPATIEEDGSITPSTAVLIKICAPAHRSLVVDFLEGLPTNLTAWESGEVFSKSMQVPGFSEMFCPPGEPGSGKVSDAGVFSQVRRIILCPKSGFDLSARNHDPYSPASFHVKGVMWSTC